MSDSLFQGILVSGYLVALVASEVVFLAWRRVPRGVIFEMVFVSTFIFSICARDVSYPIADKLVLNGGDSFWIYVPPVIPVMAFVAWSLRRARAVGTLPPNPGLHGRGNDHRFSFQAQLAPRQ